MAWGVQGGYSALTMWQAQPKALFSFKSHVSSGVTLGDAYHTGQCCSRAHSSSGWHGDLALPHCAF